MGSRAKLGTKEGGKLNQMSRLEWTAPEWMSPHFKGEV